MYLNGFKWILHTTEREEIPSSPQTTTCLSQEVQWPIQPIIWSAPRPWRRLLVFVWCSPTHEFTYSKPQTTILKKWFQDHFLKESDNIPIQANMLQKSKILKPIKQSAQVEMSRGQRVAHLDFAEAFTLSLELGLSMMYLMCPWMFSIQDASHVTVLSCCTLFHRWPAGGSGTFASLTRQRSNF